MGIEKRVLVDMSATLIHHGHIRLLKKASKLGNVIVALTSDNEIKNYYYNIFRKLFVCCFKLY